MDTSMITSAALESVSQSSFLSASDWGALVEMQAELQDTCEKRQIWRTETEMRVSVLNDASFPTKASKYWQCVREQSVFFDQLAILSFEYRRCLLNIRRIEGKIAAETDEIEKELLRIDLEEKMFGKRNMELQSTDRVRELKLWHTLKLELDDGSFDTKNVNTHQLISYSVQFLRELAPVLSGQVKASPSEKASILGKANTAADLLEKRGLVDLLPPDVRDMLRPALTA